MRRFAILGFVASVVLGLASRKLVRTGFDLWDKSFGDAAYAVMFGFGLLALWPKLSARTIGLGAFGICLALELFQLTGIPLRSPQPLRFLLGTDFGWHDIACYAVGAAVVAVLVHLWAGEHLLASALDCTGDRREADERRLSICWKDARVTESDATKPLIEMAAEVPMCLLAT